MTQPTQERFVQVNVDVQNDFCPGGSLAVTDGDAVVDPLNRLSDAVRQSGGTVIYTRDWHPASTNHFVTQGGPWPVHCVADTFGGAFHADLEVADTDIVLSKGTEVDEDAYSGFQGKGENGETLDAIVLPRSAEKVAVIIGGLATDYCVKATVLDALAFRATLPDPETITVYAVTDAMKAVDVVPMDGENALCAMQTAGAHLVTAEEALALIRQQLADAYREEN